MTKEAGDPELENRKLALLYATDNRKSEIALLWSRSLYFWGCISVILVAYGGALQAGKLLLALLAACFGLVCSFCWTLANRSGKYWKEVWEEKVKIRETDIFKPPLFPRTSNPQVVERWFWGGKQYSPSKLAMAVSDLTVVTWTSLALSTLFPSLLCYDASIKALILVATILYVLAVLIWCQSGPPLTLRQVAAGFVRSAKAKGATARRWLRISK